MPALSSAQNSRVCAWAAAGAVKVKHYAHNCVRLELEVGARAPAAAVWRDFFAATGLAPRLGAAAVADADLPTLGDASYRYVEASAGPAGEALVLLRPRKQRLLAYVVGTLAPCGAAGPAAGGAPPGRHVVLAAAPAVQIMVGHPDKRREWAALGSRAQAEALLGSLAADSGLMVPQFRAAGRPEGPMANPDERAEYVRYTGVWDLDARTEDVLAVAQGRAPLLRGGACHVYPGGPAEVKRALAAYYAESRVDCPDITARALLEPVVCVWRTIELARAMQAALPRCVAYCSGNKGCHVLCEDPALFVGVSSAHKFGPAACAHADAALLARAPGLRGVYVGKKDSDEAVHRRHTGIAVRLSPRKSTGMWPTLVCDGPLGLDGPAFPGGAGGSEAAPPAAQRRLRELVAAWFCWMCAAVPPARAPGLVWLGAAQCAARPRGRAPARAPNTEHVNGLVRAFEAEWELRPVGAEAKERLRPLISLSVQTSGRPNVEYAPSDAVLDRVLCAHAARYAEAVATGAEARAESCNAPLNESYKRARPLRFALDIDDFALSEAHLAHLYRMVLSLEPQAGASMIVCASTCPAARGQKWHLVWPRLVLPAGDPATLAAILTAEVAQDPARLPDGFALDVQIYRSYLRAPGGHAKADPVTGGLRSGVYTPWMCFGEAAAGTPFAAGERIEPAACALSPAHAAGVAALVRRACITPQDEPPVAMQAIATFRARAAAREAADAAARKRVAEAHAASGRTKRLCCGPSVAIPPGHGGVLSERFCRHAVRAYLAHAGTMCAPAEALAIADADLRVDRRPARDGCEACFVSKTGGWKLCELAQREHGKTSVGWLVRLSDAFGCSVVQHCHNDKCKALSPEDRRARAPAYECVYE
jgi:hypothetical protein